MTTIAPSHTLTFAPGMILVSTWGFEQTNVDFYLVTRTTERTVWMQPIAQRTEHPAGFMTETVVPAPDKPTGPPVRRRIIDSAHGPRAHTSMGHLAEPWTGTPERQSHYA